MSSSKAQDFLDLEDENLSNVNADVEDLVGANDQGEGEGSEGAGGADRAEGKSSLPTTFDFGHSLTSPSNMREYAGCGWFKIGQVRCLEGEAIPKLHTDEAVMFRHLYMCDMCGLRLPST